MDTTMLEPVTSHLASIIVSVIILISVIGCAVFLFSQMSTTVKKGDKVDTMGHTWDGDLQEYNNPLPAWWRNLFIITIVFALVYLLLFPGLGNFSGILKWSSTGKLAQEWAKNEEKLQATLKPWAAIPVEKLATDPKAMDSAKLLYLNNCARCHASDANGNADLGYPNLTDKDWLWGGKASDIVTTLTDGRLAGAGAGMPAHKESLSQEQLVKVSNYVLSLSGARHDAGLALQGKPTFDTVCAACHGADGKGQRALGAPNLTDNIWLYGNSFERIYASVANGRQNKMPAFKDILGEERIHLLGAYVYSLGGGEPQ